MAAVLTLALCSIAGSTMQAEAENGRMAPVHPLVQKQLVQKQLAEDKSPVSVLVLLNEQPAPAAFLHTENLSRASKTDRGAALYRYLTAFARRSQAPLWDWLDRRGVAYRPFYIVNAIEIVADADVIADLRRKPEVQRILANPSVRLSLPVQGSQAMGSRSDDFTYPDTLVPPSTPYGIDYTRAPEVWKQGYRGQGVVLASQDTGVDWTHPDLQRTYRGWDGETETADHAYDWYDPWTTLDGTACSADPQVPCDDQGHGTHTVGTMVGHPPEEEEGGLVVGMAPEASWIGCRNMDKGVGSPASYMACFQFFLAPHPQARDPFEDGDPERAPDIINNSWYCPPSEGCDVDTLAQTVETVRLAGQFIVASAGNNGFRGCGSATDPIAIYPEVFSVGAHNGQGQIAGFSNRGPVISDGSGRLKPQIVAPGQGIYSTSLNGGYHTLSGTSMSAPHVAGGIALLWSAVPDLKGQLDETEQILMKSATDVSTEDYVTEYEGDELVCTRGDEEVVPNNVYGYGRLDVAAAVRMAQSPNSVEVTPLNAERQPVPGVRVTLIDELTGYRYERTSTTDGQALFPRIYNGEYVVEAVVDGETYATSVALSENEEATVTLEAEPSAPVPVYLPLIDR